MSSARSFSNVTHVDLTAKQTFQRRNASQELLWPLDIMPHSTRVGVSPWLGALGSLVTQNQLGHWVMLAKGSDSSVMELRVAQPQGLLVAS